MKKIKTARELYCEILKSFYFGSYQMGDRLMTYQEAHETYGLAKDTIGAAYSMLRRDGFIRTNNKNRNIITFDVNNPDHVAKVPLEWPEPRPKDTDPYEVAMRLHANTLYIGLTRSNETQLQEYQKLTDDMLWSIRGAGAYYEQVLSLWRHIVSALDNEFLNRVTDHFLSRYLYLVPPDRLAPAHKRLLCDSALDFYEFLLDALVRRQFDAFPERFERHYNNYYRGRGLVFSKLEDGSLFKEQCLYIRLLDDLSVKIMAGDLRKGDALPTTGQLCREYGISKTTVNRAYGILMELGFISRRVRSGTKLIAEPSDPETRETLKKISGIYQHDWKNAAQVLMIISSTLIRRVTIAQEVVRQMEAELIRQRSLFDRYNTPFFVSAILINPLIADLPAGILHKYYAHLLEILNRILSFCTFRVNGNREHGEEINRLTQDALYALKRGNRTSFAALCEEAMRRNAEFLAADFVPGTNRHA